MECPSCPVDLQPLDPSTSYVQQAMDHAVACGVPREAFPAHGPALLAWASLVAHHATVHPAQHLAEYLEAYLSQ